MHRTICDSILDIVQNSIEAGSDFVSLDIEEDRADSIVKITVEDNGKGMDSETLLRAVDPFHTDGVKHKERKVGLGLPFVKQTAEIAGGDFFIESEPGKGTKVFFSMRLDNIDIPPMGDIPQTIVSCFNYPGTFEMEVSRSVKDHNASAGDNNYKVSRNELEEVLGSLEDIQSLHLLNDFLVSQEDSIK